MYCDGFAMISSPLMKHRPVLCISDAVTPLYESLRNRLSIVEAHRRQMLSRYPPDFIDALDGNQLCQDSRVANFWVATEVTHIVMENVLLLLVAHSQLLEILPHRAPSTHLVHVCCGLRNRKRYALECRCQLQGVRLVYLPPRLLLQ
jgi:hypothetical protein